MNGTVFIKSWQSYGKAKAKAWLYSMHWYARLQLLSTVAALAKFNALERDIVVTSIAVISAV